MLKIRIYVSSLGAAAVLLLLTSFFAQAATVTRLVLTGTPHFVPMTIDGMNRVDDIETFGKYAYAEDYYDSKISVFNGRSWLPATYFNALKNIYTAYPNTGKSDALWVFPDSWDADNPNLFHYFNGKSWQTYNVTQIIPGPKGHILYPKYAFNDSNGYGCLVVQYAGQDGVPSLYVSIYNPTTSQWGASRLLESGVALSEYDAIHVRNNTTPTFYIDVNPYNAQTHEAKGYEIIQVELRGKQKILKTAHTENAYLYHTLVDGNDLFTDHISDTEYFAYKTSPNESLLREILPPRTKELGFPELYPEEENAGLVCKALYGLRPLLNLSIGCINTNEPNASFKPTLSVANQVKALQIITRPNGAWLYYNVFDSSASGPTHVLDYDYKTNKLTDTLFPSQEGTSNNDYTSWIEAIDDSKLMVCVSNKASVVPKVYLYDKSAKTPVWQLVSNKGEMNNSCFHSFGADHPLRHIVNTKLHETLWFSDVYYSPVSDKTKSKELAHSKWYLHTKYGFKWKQ